MFSISSYGYFMCPNLRLEEYYTGTEYFVKLQKIIKKIRRLLNKIELSFFVYSIVNITMLNLLKKSFIFVLRLNF